MSSNHHRPPLQLQISKGSHVGIASRAIVSFIWSFIRLPFDLVRWTRQACRASPVTTTPNAEERYKAQRYHDAIVELFPILQEAALRWLSSRSHAEIDLLVVGRDLPRSARETLSVHAELERSGAATTLCVYEEDPTDWLRRAPLPASRSEDPATCDAALLKHIHEAHYRCTQGEAVERIQRHADVTGEWHVPEKPVRVGVRLSASGHEVLVYCSLLMIVDALPSGLDETP
jgi:hypothetical protein